MRLRKNQINEGQPSGDAGKRQGREGRGLGPFSGAQLTIIVVTFAVLLLFPVAAWATTGTTVFLTDHTTGKTATVNSVGALTVAGSVTAAPTPPSLTYNVVESASGACSNVTPAVPAGEALVVTSMTIWVTSVTTGPVVVDIDAGTTASPCSASNNLNNLSLPNSGSSVIVPFPSGLAFKTGHTVSAALSSSSGDAHVEVSVHGYLVPSTQCHTSSGGPVGCH
jgi:hypothetical protein